MERFIIKIEQLHILYGYLVLVDLIYGRELMSTENERMGIVGERGKGAENGDSVLVPSFGALVSEKAWVDENVRLFVITFCHFC